MGYFDFQDEPVSGSVTPSVTTTLPTIRPSKTPEEIAAARQKIQDYLKEADDFDSMSGSLSAPKYSKNSSPRDLVELQAQDSSEPKTWLGRSTKRIYNTLKESAIPSGQDVEQKEFQPVEDPRRAEYSQLASARRQKAAKVAADHGLDLSDFQPITPSTGRSEIRNVDETIQPVEQAKPLSTYKPGDSIENVMKANGVPENDYYQGILELSKQLGVNVDEPVNFGIGIKRVLDQPGMEDVRSEFENEAQKLVGNGGTPSGDVQKQANKDSGLQNRKDFENTEEGQRIMLKNDYHELGQEAPLHSWGSVISYVLLSMVIGPGLARLFFQKSARAGDLERDIQDRHERIKNFQRQSELASEQQIRHKEFLQQLAAHSLMNQGEKSQDRNAELRNKLFLMGVESLHQMKERARLEEKSMNDATAKANQARVKDVERQFQTAVAASHKADKELEEATFSNNPGAIDKSKKLKDLADREFWTLKELMDSMHGGSTGSNDGQASAANE